MSTLRAPPLSALARSSATFFALGQALSSPWVATASLRAICSLLRPSSMLLEGAVLQGLLVLVPGLFSWRFFDGTTV